MALRSQWLAVLLATVAGAGAGATLRLRQRPTMSEYEATKAAEADGALAAEAKGRKMAAVDKAVQMLERIKQQVLEEGEAEAKTYNKFACFCKDATAEKLQLITEGEGEKDKLAASIGKLASDRDTLDTDIQKAQDDIAGYEKEVEAATEERRNTSKVYRADAADLSAAIVALEGAIRELKASKQPSFAQLQAISRSVRTAALTADALGMGGTPAQHAMAMLLQEPAVPTEDYSFHSDDIVVTLEGLLTQFKDQQAQVDAAEVQSVADYNAYVQGREDLIKQTTTTLEKKQQERAQKLERIASESQQMSTVAASLLDDKEYMNKLSQMCTGKAQTWDQRSQLRANELSTLTQAISIIKGTVANKTTAATIRFAQQGVTVRVASALAADGPAMRAMEAEAEGVDAGRIAAASFLQEEAQPRVALLRAARRHRAESDDPAAASPEGDSRQAIAALLRSRGQELKSTLLTSLASEVVEDPFAKVKQLIQELIERLKQQAANEANQKGWCDKSLSDARQRRDFAEEEIASLEGEIETLEAIRDRLELDLARLGKEIQDIGVARNETEQERAAEKVENENTVREAQEGLAALDTCIQLLDRFYKTAEKAQVGAAFAQGPGDDAPDAGFKTGEAYTGAQAEAGGVLGMLEVMKSDFARTVQETEVAEKRAQQDHLAFMTETGKSLAEKEEAQTQKTHQKTDAVVKLTAANDNLKAETTKWDLALDELKELKATCIDTGMSYADRVARREDEIEALHQALCILENHDSVTQATC